MFPLSMGMRVRKPDAPLWQTMAVLCSCALIFCCTLTYPFNNDNALYAYMADLMLHGHLPYIGSWDQNFPGIVLVHAVQILVCGHSQLAFHAFDIVLQLIGSFLLIQIGKRLYDIRVGFLAAELCALYYVQQGLWMAGERDTYVSILLLAAFYCALERKKSFWIGVFCAFTVLFRPTYAPYTIIFLAWERWNPNTEHKWKHVGTFLLGLILPIFLTVIVYALCGGLTDFWDATVLFNLKVYGGEGASFNLWEPVRFYIPAAIAALVALWVLWRSNRSALVLWLALFAASVLSLLLLYRHSVYHYHPAMTLLIAMSAIGWIWIANYLTRYWKQFLVIIPILIVLYFMAMTLRGNTIQHVLSDIASGNIQTLEESYDRYEPSPAFGTLVQTKVGDYLAAHTHRGDTVQMFGPYSYPQYRAGLLTASRFQTLHAITMRGANDTLQPFQQAWRAEYLNAMHSEKPKFFIVCDAPEAFRQYYGGRLGHEILREDFTELGAWLDSNYIEGTKIGAFTVYKQR